jgi:hypothetical protein
VNRRETMVVTRGVTTVSDEQITREPFECVFQGLPYLT